METSDPRGDVALLFVLKDAQDMKGALAAIDDTIATLASDVRLGSWRAVDINGMEGSVVDATARSQGNAVDLSVLVIKTPSRKYLTILGVIDSNKVKVHGPTLQKILASLKPVR